MFQPSHTRIPNKATNVFLFYVRVSHRARAPCHVTVQPRQEYPRHAYERLVSNNSVN